MQVVKAGKLPRRIEYVQWAAQVVAAMSDPHPVLLGRFRELEAELQGLLK